MVNKPKQGDIVWSTRRLIKNSWFDAVIIVGALIVSLSIYWPIRFLPFIGEAATLVLDGAYTLLQRNFQPLTLVELQTSHPTLFITLVALIWQQFGEARSILHGVMLPTLPVFIYATYHIFRKWFGVSLSVVASFGIGLLPVVVSEFEMISVDLAMATLTTISLALWVHNKRLLSLVVLSLACLTKWSAIFMIVTYGIWWWAENRQTRNDYRLFLIPMLTLLGWYTYHGSNLGWWFTPPGFSLFLPDITTLVRYSLFAFGSTLFGQGRWVFTLIGIISAGYALFRKEMKTSDTWLLAGIFFQFIFVLIFLIITGDYSQPRIIFLFPLLFLAGWKLIALSISLVLTNDSKWLLPILGVCLTGIWVWHWKPPQTPTLQIQTQFPANLQYQDHITLGRLATGYIQGGFKSDTIYGGLPEGYQLTRPYLGYVTQPVNFSYCETFPASGKTEGLVYLHPYDASQIACFKLKDKYKFTLLQKFETNGIWSELHRISLATTSAELQSAN